MLRGYVLRYLALGAAGASIPEASRSAPALLRGLVVPRARRAVIAAAFETQHADDSAHVHRLAYLQALGGQLLLDGNDVEGTRRLFEQKRRPGAERRAILPLLLGVAAFMALGAAGVGGWIFATRPGPATSAPTAAIAPAEPEAPPHPLEPIFEEALPAYVVALDAASMDREAPAPEDVASRRAAVLSALERDRPALVPSMTGLFDAAEHYSIASPRGADGGIDDIDRWFNQLVRLHDALAAEDVPFFLDADLSTSRNGRQRVLLSTYRVLERRTFLAGETEVRCLDLERLDSLNFERSLLGYTRPEVRYALVLTDRIERMLIEDMLPSIHSASDSVIVRGYEDEAGIEWVTSFEEWAHEDLRAETELVIREALGRRRPLEELAAAVVARRTAIIAANQALRARGVTLREPNTYDYDVSRAADLGVRGAALDNLRGAQRTLESESVRAAYRALHTALSLSVAEHEVQHRLDYASGSIESVPEVVSQYTGETDTGDGVNRRAERANTELSAYLSQIAQRPSLARTSLIHVATFLMNRNAWRTPYAYAAVALFETLATEAGLAFEPLIQRRAIVRAEAARIYGELRAREPAAISELARRGWTRLYGAELPTIRQAE